MLEIREYQQNAIDDIAQAIHEGNRRILLVAATGSGKTVVASAIIRHAAKNGKRIVFLAHRREIIRQTSDKLRDCGVPHGIVMSSEPADPKQLVQVTSIATLHARAIRKKHDNFPAPDLVIQDECHHLLSSKSWQDIHDLYPAAIIIGMTATPITRLGKGSGILFDKMIQCPTIKELITQNFLVPVRYYVPSDLDLKGVRVAMGDYIEKDLEERLNKANLVGDVIEQWSRIALKEGQRKTLVFGVSVKHSMHLAARFNEVGVKAEHIDAMTPKDLRDDIISRFKTGDVKILCNCQIFSEGFDCPEASMLVFARPTKSLLLYLQVAGRILRPCPGKKDAVIIDHAGVFAEHDRIDQDWDWRLEYHEGETAKSATHKLRRPAKSMTCFKCKHVFTGRIDCPACGERLKVGGKEVNTWDGMLLELESQVAPPCTTDKSIWWSGLKWYALQKFLNPKMSKDGYPSWAYAKYQEKFGQWPHHSFKKAAPKEPPTDILAWIKYTQIKWAKSQQKEWAWKRPEPAPLAPVPLAAVAVAEAPVADAQPNLFEGQDARSEA